MPSSPLPRVHRSYGARFGIGAVLLAVTLGLPRLSTADTLASESEIDGNGYIAIDELSHEAIIVGGGQSKYESSVELRLRSALHNASSQDRDAVLQLALPPSAKLIGISSADGETWIPGKPTPQSGLGEQGEREPGSIYVRQLPAVGPGALPSLLVVLRAVKAGSTTQVELKLEVRPQLRAGRWHLILPSRQARQANVNSARRVIVQGLRAGEDFAVDGVAASGSPMIETRSDDAVLVSWPARGLGRKGLTTNLVAIPDEGGQGGQLRLGLQLGAQAGRTPQHVVFIVDRSRSTEAGFANRAAAAIRSTLAALPKQTKYELITFAREAHRLKGDDRLEQLALLPRLQGSNIEAALDLAFTLPAPRRAKGKTLRRSIVVMTDGMLPETLDLQGLASHRERSAANRTAELVFLVDDPRLAELGLDEDHSTAKIAAALGARVMQTRLVNWPSLPANERIARLTEAPKILRELELIDSARVEWSNPPSALVAGNYAEVHGRYRGKSLPRIRVRGKLGSRSIERRSQARKTTAELGGFVTSGSREEVELAAREGFALPQWYSKHMARRGELSVVAASRIGRPKVGRLDQKTVRRYLRTKVLPRARACYNRALVDHQTQSGRVVLEFEVGKGEVMLAKLGAHELRFPDPRLLECLLDAAWKLELPAGHLDVSQYRLSYPLKLAPPKDGRPPAARPEQDPVFEFLMNQQLPGASGR